MQSSFIIRLMKLCGFLLVCLTASAADTVVDNDRVRILAAVDQPHHKGDPHGHAVNRVMIYLDAGDVDVVTGDGRIDHQHWKAGDIAWSPAVARHTSENLGATPIRIV